MTHLLALGLFIGVFVAFFGYYAWLSFWERMYIESRITEFQAHCFAFAPAYITAGIAFYLLFYVIAEEILT